MKGNTRVRMLVEASVTAALYAALALAFPMLSFGPIQLRVSEVLTVLPVMMPSAVPGLSVGCLLANLIGLALGANPLGAWDILLGTAATALAAWLSYLCRRVQWFRLPILSVLFPVVINAVVVGAEQSFAMTGGFDPVILTVCAGEIAIGELITCVIGGLILFVTLRRLDPPWLSV